MKAVPKVNSDGYYIEDTLVDDAFTGVVPFYTEPKPIEPDEEAPTEQTEDTEPVLDGYIVGIPVVSGLYLPKFDLAAWEAREDTDMTDPSAYWIEGLTQDEINKLTQPPIPSDIDRIGQQLAELKLQTINQQSVISSMGEELVQTKLTTIDQQQTIASLGSELAAAKLEIIGLKGGQTV